MHAPQDVRKAKNACAKGGSVKDDDLDFGDEDFHDSSVEAFDISDVKINAYRNKGLTRIDIVLKSQTPMGAMKLYAALKAYVFKIEMEMHIFEENESEH